jgi:hypothetical protein
MEEFAGKERLLFVLSGKIKLALFLTINCIDNHKLLSSNHYPLLNLRDHPLPTYIIDNPRKKSRRTTTTSICCLLVMYCPTTVAEEKKK